MGVFFTDRGIFDHEIWTNVLKFRLFFYLYGNAVFAKEGCEVYGIHLERGQILKSYRALQRALQYIENNSVKEYSVSSISRAIKDLIKERMIDTHDTELGTVFTLCNYDKYQSLMNTCDNGLKQRKNSGGTALEQQENNNIKDIKVKEKTSSPGNNGDGYSEGFKMFWKAYPRRAGKGKAFAQWKKVAKDSQVRKEIMKAIPLQIKSGVLRTDDLQYCPHPATWLNQRRWEDEIPEISKTAQKGFDNVPDAI
jgi:hypothetical protein